MHCHGFGRSAGATPRARSQSYPQQVFAHGAAAFGFQSPSPKVTAEILIRSRIPVQSRRPRSASRRSRPAAVQFQETALDQRRELDRIE